MQTRPQDLETTQIEDRPLTPQNRSWQRATTYLFLMLLSAGLASGCSRLVASPTSENQNKNAAVATSSTQTANPTSETSSAIVVPTNFVTEVVNRVGSAVVRIDTQRTVSNSFPDAFNHPGRFFGEALPAPSERQVQSGTGSGFIIDAKGLVVTNAHVIEGVDTVSVTLKDGRRLEGKVVGRDTVTDVAVVQIEADNLPAVKLGNSDRLQAGEWAIAIGNPLGLDNSVTTGIISATGRSSSQIGVPDKRVEFIQTDAAINPGNSGGPLLNQNGEAIGMNTAILQGAQGLGFAIPIETVKEIADQLVATGQAEHPYLGIQMVTLTPEIKNNLNRDFRSGLRVNENEGVLIVQVMANSPADNAGLRPGDTVRKINGKGVKTADEVQQAMNKVEVGSQVQVELRRNGETLNSNVRAGTLPQRQS